MSKPKRKLPKINRQKLEVKTLCPNLKGNPENAYVSAKLEKVKQAGHKLMQRRLILRKLCSKKIAQIDARLVKDPITLGLLLMKFDKDLLNDHNLKILCKSSSVELRKVAVEFAKTNELLMILTADENPEVLARLIDKVEDPEILVLIAGNKKLDKTLMGKLIKKAIKKEGKLDYKLIKEIISSEAMDSDFLIEIAKLTVDQNVIDMILRSEHCNGGVLRMILAKNIIYDDIVMKILKHRNTNKYLWAVAAKYSKSHSIWNYCAKSRHKIVLRTLSKRNRAALSLVKNPHSDYGVLFDLITKNPKNPFLIKAALRHKVASKNNLLWLTAAKATKDPEALDMISAHRDPKVRKTVVDLKAKYLSKRAFKLLVNDTNQAVSNKLKYHKNKKVRKWAVRYAKDPAYIAKVAKKHSEALSIVTEIIVKKVIDLATETALANDPRAEVRKALAKRKRLYKSTHVKLAGDKSKAVLSEYAKRKDIKSPQAIEKLAGSVYKEIQMTVLRNNPSPPVYQIMGEFTKHESVINHVLNDARIEIRKWVAERRQNFNGEIGLKLAKDKSQSVKVSLLKNQAFVKWFKRLPLMKELTEIAFSFVNSPIDEVLPSKPQIPYEFKILRELNTNAGKQLSNLIQKVLNE